MIISFEEYSNSPLQKFAKILINYNLLKHLLTRQNYDFLPEIELTKKMTKEHFETFDNIEDAINMIFKYDYVLAEFNLIFLNAFLVFLFFFLPFVFFGSPVFSYPTI